jgi:hypothetical protein
MKRTLWFIFFLLNSLFYLYADSENDSLLKVLDKVISERLIYTQKKEATIKELKKKKVGLNSLEDIYNLNKYKKDIMELEGYGEKSVTNMLNAVLDRILNNEVTNE